MTATDLLRSGRSAMEPTREDRERVRNRLAAKLGAAAVGATITTTTAKAAGATAAAKTGTTALALKIVLPLLVLGGAAAVATPHLLHRAAPEAAPTPVVVASQTTPAPVVTSEPVTSVTVDELPTAAPKPALAKKPVTTVTDPAEEAKLVASIDAALRAGDATTALRLADEHAKKYPNGVLVEEREGGRAVARCMSGSRASADAFLAAHPRSPMRARIVAACGEKP